MTIPGCPISAFREQIDQEAQNFQPLLVDTKSHNIFFLRFGPLLGQKMPLDSAVTLKTCVVKFLPKMSVIVP